MQLRNLWLSTLASLGAAAQGTNERIQVGPVCAAVFQDSMLKLARSTPTQAEDLLKATLSGAGSSTDHLCLGLVFHNLATARAGSGLLAEAEAFAMRSIATLANAYSSDDPILFWPLQVLAAVEFELGKIGRTTETLKRMQSVRAPAPEQRASMLGISASLLLRSRPHEAEQQFMEALSLWSEAGRGDSADAGGLLNSLAVIYIEQGRVDDARRVLDRAFEIFDRSKDSVPMDYIKALNSRGAVSAQTGQWTEAQRELKQAVALANGQPHISTVMMASLLKNFAVVLRKTGQRREARVVMTQLRNLRIDRTQAAAIIDITELVPRDRGKD